MKTFQTKNLYSSKYLLNFALETERNRHDMIKKRGTFEVRKEGADLEELISFADNLPEDEYEYVIYDKNKNRSLPQLKYLFGVVLKIISEQHPDHPPVDALYRWFEQVYAPLHSCIIEGQEFEYVDLKNENSVEMDYVIQRIIRHAHQKWGIKIPDRDVLKAPEARELYTDAYAEVWKCILPTSSSTQHEQQSRR